MNNLKFLLQRSEIGAGTRGSSLSFPALNVAAWKKKSGLFTRISTSEIPNQNHRLLDWDQSKEAKNIDGILQVYRDMSDAVLQSLENGEFPFVLSSDHASAGGTIAGLRKSFPDRRIGIVWVDAHADLHTPYTSPSGNMHGMPLGASLGVDNESNGRRQPDQSVVEQWDEIKGLNGVTGKIKPEDICFFGVRSTEPEEEALMAEYNMKNFGVKEIRNNIQSCLDEADQYLANCEVIYVSFDVDSMDPELVSNGTGTPVKNGLTPDEAKGILKHYAAKENLVCFEMVEINPCLDEKGNKMAETAFDILEEIVEGLESK